MSEFESFCEVLLDLDSRERRRLVNWQRTVATFAEFMASLPNEGVVVTLSNHAHESSAFVQALQAIGAVEVSQAVSRFVETIRADGLGDENGFEVATIYGRTDLSMTAEKIDGLLQAREGELWRQVEAYARGQSGRLEPIARDGTPLIPLLR